MKICGIKLSHDAAVCVIDDGRLDFCVEMEKIDNGARYTKMKDFEQVNSVLASFGYTMKDMDSVVIDGWKFNKIDIDGLSIPVAGHHDEIDLLRREEFKEQGGYVSYCHEASHVVGAYVTSPFSEIGNDSLVLVWDGGQQPKLWHVNPKSKFEKFQYIGSLFQFFGTIYAAMGHWYGPYKRDEIRSYIGNKWLPIATSINSYDIPGKLMSYIGLGKVNEELIQLMESIYLKMTEGGNVTVRLPESNWEFENNFLRNLNTEIEFNGKTIGIKYRDEDILLSLHTWLERMIVGGVCSMTKHGENLCFAGGSALNIKWNSALRETNYFADVWVPPFPNDCGSAIGTAACEMVKVQGLWSLDWNVFSGPEIIPPGFDVDGWESRVCNMKDLAMVLYLEPESPVVFLHSRAELGPRALGHRSILSNPIRAENKELLNGMKKREAFRPVAPICLEHYAERIFDPGTPDPYMLFDHKVREDWVDQIPAIMHIDGTARLQTINENQCRFMHDLLSWFYTLSGIPLLCNTSANYNGKGFFPSVLDAMVWGQAKYIWCQGKLYTRVNHGN